MEGTRDATAKIRQQVLDRILLAQMSRRRPDAANLLCGCIIIIVVPSLQRHRLAQLAGECDDERVRAEDDRVGYRQVESLESSASWIPSEGEDWQD